MPLQPGLIAPTEFYKTYSPVQSKFNWGQKGFQMGPTFDPVAYNQAVGSETPWGLQDIGKPLTSQEIIDMLNGIYKLPTPARSATRVEQYNPASYLEPVGLGPVVPRVQNTTTTGTTATGPVVPRLTPEQVGLVGEYRNIGLTDEQIATILGVSVESIRNMSQP
jgi:hypothetical protein